MSDLLNSLMSETTSEDIRIESEDHMEAAENQEQEAALLLAKQLAAEAGMPICPTFNRTPENLAKYGYPSDILPLIRPVVGSAREAARIPTALRTPACRKAVFLAKYRRDNEKYFASWSK